MALRAASSGVAYRWTYDVFLSFRGEDTRSGFTGNLYNTLRQRGFYAFIDDEGLRRGEEITPALFEAIQQSKIAIVVLSKNYAFSTFCLDELVEILECFKEESQEVWPIFYDVDPSDVRNLRGNFGEALAQHQNRFKDDEEKVQKWRLALSKTANLSGWHIKCGVGYEYEFIGRIIDEVSRKTNYTPLHVADCPVGLVSRVQKVTSLLDLSSEGKVIMVGIWGIGGIGKSTVSKAVYNSIADTFDGSCFLSNVREISDKNGLIHLQETLISKLVKEKDVSLGDVHEGISILRHRLNRKKVLLILDDVVLLEQLQALAGRCDWFGFGSRIIITTRNKHLLVSHGIERVYDVEELNDEEALKLFSWKAFKQDKVHSSYRDAIDRAILYSSGHPLALEVIGSNLCGKRIDEWSSALDRYEKIPNKEVLEVLKLSYDALEEDEKEIFLDLACFSRGYRLQDVTNILVGAHDTQPEYAIGALVDKSLVKISPLGTIEMHDLVQDMGKEIVRQESPKEPGNRSRLWLYKDIIHVLQEDTGTDKIEAIILDLPQYKEVHIRWSGKELKKMKNLKVLIIRNACFSRGPKYLPNSLRVLEWKKYPLKFLPDDFYPAKLFYLDLSYSCCLLLKPLQKKFQSLSYLNFKNCKFLKQVPNLSGVPHLTELWLNDCLNLIEIDDSVGFLDKLRRLSAKRCTMLRNLPHVIKWTSLECIELFGCSSLQSFPNIMCKMEKLRKLSLYGTAIEELPSSICNLIGLQYLNLRDCKHLKRLPTSIHLLPKLWILEANFCSELRYFKKWEDGELMSSDSVAMSSNMATISFLNCNLLDDFIASCLSSFPNMMSLDLSFSNFTTLPACIKEFQLLKYLSLDGCKKLQRVAGMPPNLSTFTAKNCTLLTWLSSSILLHQSFHQPGKRSVFLPGESIPKWFDHYGKGNSLCFWVQKQFPAIVVCVLFGDFYNKDCPPEFCLSVQINGTGKRFFSEVFSILTMELDHIYLCDLQSILCYAKLPKADEWNQVQVSVQQEIGILKKGVEIKCIGVHVYKQENRMENILFMKPDRLKRKYHNYYNSNNDLEQDFNSIDDSEKLALINSMPSAGCATATKLKEKDMKVYSEGSKLSTSPCCKEHGDYMNRDSNSKRPKLAANDQIECQLRSFPVTPSTTASCDGIGRELLQIYSSTVPTVLSNTEDQSLNGIEAEDAEPSIHLPSTSTGQSKETQKSLKALKDLLSKIFLYCCIWDTSAP